MKKLLTILSSFALTITPISNVISCNQEIKHNSTINLATIDKNGLIITLTFNNHVQLKENEIHIKDSNNLNIQIKTISKNQLALNFCVYRNEKLSITYKSETPININTSLCPLPNHNTIQSAIVQANGLDILLIIGKDCYIDNWRDIIISDDKQPSIKIINATDTSLHVSSAIHNDENVLIQYRKENSVVVDVSGSLKPDENKSTIKSAKGDTIGLSISLVLEPHKTVAKKQDLQILSNYDKALVIQSIQNNTLTLNNAMHNQDQITLQYKNELPLKVDTSMCPSPKMPAVDLSKLSIHDNNYKINLNQLHTISDLRFDIINEFILNNHLSKNYDLLTITSLCDENGISLDKDEELNQLTNTSSIAFIISGTDSEYYQKATELLFVPVCRAILDISMLNTLFDERYLDKKNIVNLQQLSEVIYQMIGRCNNFEHVNSKNSILKLYGLDQKTPFTIFDLKTNNVMFFSLASNLKDKSIVNATIKPISLIISDSTNLNFIKDYEMNLTVNESEKSIIKTIKSATEQSGYLYQLISQNEYYHNELFDPDKLTWDMSKLTFDTSSPSLNHTRTTTFTITAFDDQICLVNIAYNVEPNINQLFDLYRGDATYINPTTKEIHYDPFLIPTGTMISTVQDPISVSYQDFQSSGINLYAISKEIKNHIRKILTTIYPDIKINEVTFAITYNEGAKSWIEYTQSLLNDAMTRQAWLDAVLSNRPSYDKNHNLINHPARGIFSGNASFNLYLETDKFLFIEDGLHFIMQMHE